MLSSDAKWHDAPHFTLGQIKLPDIDADGRPLRPKYPLRVALLPTCSSCAVKHLSPGWPKIIEQATDLVVVFDSRDMALKHYTPLSKMKKLSFLFSPQTEAMPFQLQGLAPGIVTLNEKGTVVKVETL